MIGAAPPFTSSGLDVGEECTFFPLDAQTVQASDYCQIVVCCALSLKRLGRRYMPLKFCGSKQFTG